MARPLTARRSTTPKPFVEAEHWRKLAGAARSKAARITNAQTRQMILNVAQTYDRLAEQADWEKPPGKEASD
jgi:hypothetical protein